MPHIDTRLVVVGSYLAAVANAYETKYAYVTCVLILTPPTDCKLVNQNGPLFDVSLDPPHVPRLWLDVSLVYNLCIRLSG